MIFSGCCEKLRLYTKDVQTSSLLSAEFVLFVLFFFLLLLELSIASGCICAFFVFAFSIFFFFFYGLYCRLECNDIPPPLSLLPFFVAPRFLANSHFFLGGVEGSARKTFFMGRPISEVSNYVFLFCFFFAFLAFFFLDFSSVVSANWSTDKAIRGGEV